VVAQPLAAEKRRAPLTRERVLRAAVELADERGIEALTMRNLGQALGVEAMSLYNHVENKEDILDGITGVVMEEILAAAGAVPPPAGPAEWKIAMRRRILAARTVMLRHRWAPGVFESRTGMPPTGLQHSNSLLGLMRTSGFSIDLAHHAMHALGSRMFGFSQELFMSGDEEEVDPEMRRVMIRQMSEQLPYVGELMRVVYHDDETTLGGCDDQFEFEFGLDLLLDGLDRLRDAEWRLTDGA
jgi:AcrR family transcriptional regulator